MLELASNTNLDRKIKMSSTLPIKTKWSSVIAAALLGLVCSPVFSQGYPVKPIRLMVGAAPGGTTDIVARTVADKLGELLGQSLLGVNRSVAW